MGVSEYVLLLLRSANMISHDIPVRDLCSLRVSWKVVSVFDGDEMVCSASTYDTGLKNV
jgi:hypothetical protein